MERTIFSEEHKIFQDNFKKYVEREIVPKMEEWEHNKIVPREDWKKMGDNGYLCPWMEEKYGGYEADFLYSVIIAEEFAAVGETGFAASLHSDVIVPYIHSFGNEEQKMKWLPGCATGDTITAVAMTEPGAGSDLANIRTTAIRDGDEYVINGQKTFISNGINCDLVVLAAKTDPSAGMKGVSLIVVENGTPGFSKGRKLDKMGMWSQDTAELYFEDCRVPVANLLGKEGHGFYYLMEKLERERLSITLGAQRMAEAMLELTIKYCNERTVFGKPLGKYQHSTFKLVEMATEIELGRTFMDQLISAHMEGKSIVKEVSMAKAWVCEMANRVAYNCLQLHGGYGYMEEYPICKFYRNIRSFPIVGGTTEVMKVIVGKMIGL